MTSARGTMGYIAPEILYRNFGRASYKSDVYSSGMLLLEMSSRRVDIRIEEDNDATVLKKLAIAGLLCIQWYPTDRPSMKVVVQMLEGDGDDLTMPSLSVPAKSIGGIHGRPYQVELAVISESE
ncbi:rust resistance kinase Lr10-like [Olea europaea subsp. europaea]|uniref:Rust resistance kinase Lr10-like n=1 Tax=Olea europaea subsp. europaea TaxID=158383 RepID=A0A8S0VGN3_OLEEU|nr:rust resistance kinase Lr10-like [Olea europaea subsp. europaea]